MTKRRSLVRSHERPNDRGEAHPDDHALIDDWFIYGPRSDRIFQLVERLAGHGVRVADIELAIEQMLEKWLGSHPGDAVDQ